MRCPHCKRIVSESAVYCPECGLSRSNKKQYGKEYVDNWSNSKEIFRSYDDAIKSATNNYKAERRSNRKKNLLTILVVCLIIIAYSLFAVYRNKQNAMILSTVSESIIGNVYDDSSQSILTGGDICDRKIVEVIDENSAHYTHGSYKYHVINYDIKNFSDEWIEEHIYEDCVYSYELSISFFGKVYFKMNGERYYIELQDDNTARYIRFYD